ncbi:MAG TPA: AraC family transcriptional regulator [Streptosporangiaceae bacterium]
MTDATMTAATDAATTTEYGLLGEREFRLDRVPAAPDLAPWLERHWLVAWELPAGRRSAATLLPHPCVNLVLDGGRLVIAGVGRERFSYELAGRGRVFGVKFRPGAFLPFFGAPVSRLTDRTVPAADVWGAAAAELEAALVGAAPDPSAFAAQVRAAEDFLRSRRPAPDPNVELVGTVVRALLYDREIARVEDVARRFGMSTRTLQRLFQRYVGVTPKWVLRRYRLHEAAARLAGGASDDSGTWAGVATELGYFDQSHFIRDFAAAVGVTPVEYAAACARGLVTIRT